MKNYKFIIFFIIVSFIAVLIETTLINFPAVFLLGVVSAVFIKKIPMYIGVFLLSFMIDSVRVSHFGMTALFIFATVICTMIYEKYSGSDDILITSIIICAALFAYSQFLSYSLFFLMVFLGIIIVGWYLLTFFRKRGAFFL